MKSGYQENQISNLLRLIKLQHVSFPFIPFFQSLSYTLPCSPSNSWTLFSLIVTIYLYVSKYNLLNFYVYVFMANYLSLSNHLVCPSLRKISHSQLSSVVCTIVPCVEWRDRGLFLIQSGMSLGVILIQFLCGQSC